MAFQSCIVLLSLALAAGQALAQSPFSTPPRNPATIEKWTDAQKEQISALAEKTAVALQEHDHFLLRQWFDVDRFVKELLLGLTLPSSEDEAMRRDLRGYLLGKKGGMLGTMNLSEKIEVGFVGLRTRGERLVARFRVVENMITFNYWDLEPCLSAGKEIRWFDMSETGLGESEIDIRRCFTYANAVAEGHLGEVARSNLTDADKDVLRFGKWQSSPDVKGDAQSRLAELGKMPGSKAPIIEKYRLAALQSMTDREAFQKASDSFAKTFPADPATVWIQFQSLLSGADNATILRFVEKISASYGPDPFLDAFAAALLAKDKKFTEAVPLAKKAVAAVPNHQLGHYILAGAALATSEYETAATAMKTQMEKFGMHITRNGLLAREPKFCESEPGRKFLEKLPD